MAATVLLKDVIEALEMQLDDYSSYFDLDSGQVVTVSDDALRAVEEEEEEAEGLREWDEEARELAERIVSTDRFIALPSKFDVHEWGIMRDFSSSMTSDLIREELLDAIHGAGAFRQFKLTIRRHAVESAWFAYLAEAMRKIAIEWCEEHRLEWE